MTSSKLKGEFCPYKYHSQPRSLADIHDCNVDPADFDKIPTTFESAKKQISDFALTEIRHFEKAAITPIGRHATLKEYSNENNKTKAVFYVQEISDINAFKRRQYVLFDFELGKYFKAYVEQLNGNTLTVVIVDYDLLLFMKHKEGPLDLYQEVNYSLFINQLKALDRIAANRDVIRKLAYETPLIDEDTTSYDNKFGRMQLSSALSFPMLSKEQELAVELMTRHSNTTFVLNGPTGTGKTVALMKTVLQLVQSGGRVLVTTTSNYAADAFTQDLIDHGFKDKNLMLHLIKSSYEPADQSDEVKAVSACDVPDDVHQLSVVIATVGYLFKLHNKITFSHIIVENAHEVPEVDIWTCLSTFGLSKETRLILAGDLRLPGPHSIVSNIYSNKIFFKQPMMKRLVNTAAFQQHPELMITLTENHRSHPAIVNTLQTLSYSNSMISTRKEGDFDKRLYEGFKYPITFCNVKVADGDANHYEVYAIVKYVEMLKKTVPENEIGIIAAGRTQQNLLKQMLNKTRIKIGTAFTFGGSERRIILFSAQCGGDYPDHLTEPGFLNLVMSRATDLIVFVGNGDYLEQLNDWKFVIDVCKENNAYNEGFAMIIPPPPKPQPYVPPPKRQQRTSSNASQRRNTTGSSSSSDVSSGTLETMQTLMQTLNGVMSHVNALVEERKKFVQPKDFERGRSLVILGMPESRCSTPSARMEDDRKKMVRLFDIMNIEVTPASIYRTPLAPPSDPRAPARRLTVVLANDRDRNHVFSNTYKLKDHPEFGRIGIQPVHTEKEHEHYKLCKHIKKEARERENVHLVYYRSRLCKPNGNIRQAPEKLTRMEFLEWSEKYPLPENVEIIDDESEFENE
uniref:RNA helicase n=1 Tax=Panagrellus redivivus TaxID=6233 RepID=A0A7E4V7X7_PANRE